MAFAAALPFLAQGAGMLAGSMMDKGQQNPKMKSFDNLSPEQKQRFQELIQQSGMSAGMQYLQGLASGDESTFAESEAPAMRQLGQMQGDLASRFSGMGMGGRRSSGFQNAVGSQAQQMAENLAAKRQGLRLNAIKDLMGLNTSLLGVQSKGNYWQNPSQKRSLVPGIAQLGGAAIGGLAGGSAGIEPGFNIGEKFGKSFMGGVN